jgi:hypothetical protein
LTNITNLKLHVSKSHFQYAKKFTMLLLQSIGISNSKSRHLAQNFVWDFNESSYAPNKPEIEVYKSLSESESDDEPSDNENQMTVLENIEEDTSETNISFAEIQAMENIHQDLCRCLTVKKFAHGDNSRCLTVPPRTSNSCHQSIISLDKALLIIQHCVTNQWFVSMHSSKKLMKEVAILL